MKAIFLSVLSAVLPLSLGLPVLACSEIAIGSGTYNISARNFDFPLVAAMAVIRPRGFHQQNESNTNSHAWTSKYGSVSFYIKLPEPKTGPVGLDWSRMAGVDGLNEKGLKVGTYFLAESTFQPSDSRKTIPVNMLMQFYLDNCQSVDEIVAAAQEGKQRVVSMLTEQGELKLHVYAHDATGDSVIIEYLAGKVVIHRRPVVRVLTNTPYDEAIRVLKNYEDFGGKEAIPGGTESLDRFVRGAYYLKHVPVPSAPKEAVAYGFDTIQTVAVTPGFDDRFTQWSVVTDITSKKMYFRTAWNPQICFLDLNEVNFSEGRPIRCLDFITRDNLSGNVLAAF